jgi:type III pantothenate kinase
MILTVNIGNSSIVFGLFKSEELAYHWRFDTVKDAKEAKKYKKEIINLLKQNNLKNSDIEGIVISSVVPQITSSIKDSFKFLNKKILVIGDKDVKTNMIVKIDEPEELGSDILMNALAGKEKFGENFIIIDMGTATTFNIIGKNGDFLGAVIAPGVALSCKALSDGCAKLPEWNISIPKKLIGKNTIDAINAGIYFGHIGVIKEIIDRIQTEYGQKMTICLTGGMSTKFKDGLDFVDEVDKDLTLKGLKLVWNINN